MADARPAHPENAQEELYLTDSVALLVADGHRVAVHRADDPREAEGVNTRAELAAAAATLRDRVNEAHMLAGATIVDPASTWIDVDVVARAGCGRPSVHGRARRIRGSRAGRRSAPMR